MVMRRVLTGLAVVSVLVVPAIVVTHQGALAAGAPKAEWRPGKTGKATVPPKAKKTVTPKAKRIVAPRTPVEPETPLLETPPPPQPSAAVDQSQEVLDVDAVMAASIAAQGPKDGYASALSDEGILYDANGASPVGREAATSRFGSFPADVTLVRTPERALAAGGSGSSWGTYTIKRGEAILSTGRYISVWRREVSGWKMISELAAGKTLAPPPSTPISGILPKRPTQMGRAAPAAIGVPLTIPVPPASAPTSQAPPTP